MNLYIAEKPSLAKKIAAALGRATEPGKTQKGFIQGTDWQVTWCLGHMYCLWEPQDYDKERWGTWSIDQLPIIPPEFKYKPIDGRGPQLSIIRKLITKASRVFHCGDPDNEGQFLVDLTLSEIGCNLPVQRLWPNDLSSIGLDRLINSPLPNADFSGFASAAQERGVADWLVGMNLTRLYTLWGRKANHEGVISLGRVQTPTLGLVYNRCKQIEEFTPVAHFGVRATLATSSGETFDAQWVPTKDMLDDQGYLTRKEIATSVAERIVNSQAVVSNVDTKQVSEKPPLPHSLQTLQSEASKRIGLSAAATLQLTQFLYEHMGLVTYPRSDCQYLTEGDFADAPAQTQNALEYLQDDRFAAIDLTVQPRCYDESVTSKSAHTAIVPTLQKATAEAFAAVSTADLSKAVKGASHKELEALYRLVVQRFLQSFMAPYTHDATTITLSCQKQAIVAKGKVVTQIGWKATVVSEKDASENPEDDDDDGDAPLPGLEAGDPCRVQSAAVKDRLTKAPAYFTEGTLIEAMSGIAKYVDEPEIRKVLSDNDGIGTPATQSQIIETLKQRDYIEVVKKKVRMTDRGNEMFVLMPSFLQVPNLTAAWELGLRRIADKANSGDSFRSTCIRWLSIQMEELLAAPPTFRDATDTRYPHKCGGHFQRRKSKKGTAYWRCNECGDMADEHSNAPVKPLLGHGSVCPACSKGTLITRVARKRKGKGRGSSGALFLSCTAYPECKHIGAAK